MDEFLKFQVDLQSGDPFKMITPATYGYSVAFSDPTRGRQVIEELISALNRMTSVYLVAEKIFVSRSLMSIAHICRELPFDELVETWPLVMTTLDRYRTSPSVVLRHAAHCGVSLMLSPL